MKLLFGNRLRAEGGDGTLNLDTYVLCILLCVPCVYCCMHCMLCPLWVLHALNASGAAGYEVFHIACAKPLPLTNGYAVRSSVPVRLRMCFLITVHNVLYTYRYMESVMSRIGRRALVC
jgi:hypothetical protein